MIISWIFPESVQNLQVPSCYKIVLSVLAPPECYHGLGEHWKLDSISYNVLIIKRQFKGRMPTLNTVNQLIGLQFIFWIL